jgi:hypothetical protein
MQTCPVRVLLTGCATALLLVTGCDVGTASGDEPYGTNDVLRVFRSSGIHLESQRLEDGGTCPDPAAVAAIRPDGVECRAPAAGAMPRSRAVLWNERELGRWVIWVYGSEDDARALEASQLFPNRVGPPSESLAPETSSRCTSMSRTDCVCGQDWRGYPTSAEGLEPTESALGARRSRCAEKRRRIFPAFCPTRTGSRVSGPSLFTLSGCYA